jgi:hypothetical protein
MEQMSMSSPGFSAVMSPFNDEMNSGPSSGAATPSASGGSTFNLTYDWN